ncbi:MAG: phospholipid carrier-dependent glycosyltransferase [Chloroflexi bacterium]|nr:phospholipid carrier-dependent glycosyltransferase [Chloroflexota bacterium]
MRRSALLALVIGYLALLGALRVSENVFERLPHLEDEIAYLYQARIFAGGQIYVETPQPARAFWQPFVIDCRENDTRARFQGLDCDGKRFSKYPPGWSLLLAPGTAASLEWAVNPLLFLLTILVTYRLGREIYDERVGIIAALLLAISPIALLQSGSLMAHPAALFFATLFLYGMWRLEQGPRAIRWGVLAGMSLGMVIAIRPFTGTSVAAPLVAYSGLRLGAALSNWAIARMDGQRQWSLLSLGWRVAVLGIPIAAGTAVAYWVASEITFWPEWPVLAMGAAIGVLALYTALKKTSAPLPRRQNPRWPSRPWLTLAPLLAVALFTLVIGALWPAYNLVTVGEPFKNLYELIWDYDKPGFGPEYGRSGHTWEKARLNLGWDTHCYSRDLLGWVEQPDDPPPQPGRGNSCMRGSDGLSWLLLPLGLVLGWRRRWTYLLLLVAVAVIGGTLWFWINAGVYSARYYYEASTVLIILSAAGAVGLADLLKPFGLHIGVYALLGILVSMSLLGYTPDRLEGLYRYNGIGRHQIEGVDHWRTDPERPVVVVEYGGDGSWRNLGAIMALTSPYLDSEYILARDPDRVLLPQILARFPDYQVVYYADGQFMPAPPNTERIEDDAVP